MAAIPESKLVTRENSSQTPNQDGNEARFVLLCLGIGCGCVMVPILSILALAIFPLFLGQPDMA